MVPEALTRDVNALNAQGLKLSIVELQGQSYVLVSDVQAPSPPWNRSSFDILIAIPLRYDQAALDAFYLELPYQYNGGAHDRVNGGELDLQGRKWKLVSWHYLDGKPWTAGNDTLESHIEHCRGFFLTRGVRS